MVHTVLPLITENSIKLQNRYIFHYHVWNAYLMLLEQQKQPFFSSWFSFRVLANTYGPSYKTQSCVHNSVRNIWMDEVTVWTFKFAGILLNGHGTSTQRRKLEICSMLWWYSSFQRNFEKHLDHLKQVFQRLQKANLTLKPSKCKLAVKEVKYLGHVITKEGVKVDPTKTSAVIVLFQYQRREMKYEVA